MFSVWQSCRLQTKLLSLQKIETSPQTVWWNFEIHHSSYLYIILPEILIIKPAVAIDNKNSSKTQMVILLENLKIFGVVFQNTSRKVDTSTNTTEVVPIQPKTVDNIPDEKGTSKKTSKKHLYTSTFYLHTLQVVECRLAMLGQGLY